MATTQSKDPNEQVHHPRWYNNHPSGVEAIEIIEHLPANLSHAFKYIWRCGLKTANDPLRELRSAEWYVRREIQRRDHFVEPVREMQRRMGFEPDQPHTEAVRQWQSVVGEAPWRQLAEKIVADAKSRETYDLLAFCLGDLLRDDLEGLAKRLEKAILGVW